MYVLIYVDDIIITGSSSAKIKQLISDLSKAFALKELGDLNYFLGIEVHTLPDGSLHMSQSKYVRDLLVKANMWDAKSLPTPMVSNLKLSKHGSSYLSDPTLYRSIVGALQYVTITRPELAFSVSKVC